MSVCVSILGGGGSGCHPPRVRRADWDHMPMFMVSDPGDFIEENVAVIRHKYLQTGNSSCRRLNEEGGGELLLMMFQDYKEIFRMDCTIYETNSVIGRCLYIEVSIDCVCVLRSLLKLHADCFNLTDYA